MEASNSEWRILNTLKRMDGKAGGAGQPAAANSTHNKRPFGEQCMNTYSPNVVGTITRGRMLTSRKHPIIKLTCFVAVFFFLLGDSARSATPVCGFVPGGHWTVANSPYNVTCDVQVFGTLIIDPGVVVRFDGNYEFQVGGRVQADGAIFTPLNRTNCWKGILFFDAVPGSSFNNTIIEGSCQSGVRITNTPPTFTNCIIRNNFSPTYGGGILAKVTGQPLVLVGCTISNNVANGAYGGGVYLDGSLLLVQSTVVSNRAPSYAGGLYVENGNQTLRNCVIAFNTSSRGTGLLVGSAGGTATLVNCIVTGNGNSEAIYLNRPASLINCTMVGNGGYSVYNVSGYPVGVTNSILYFNDAGLAQFAGTIAFAYCDVQGGVQPGPGNISFAPGLCPNQSLIQGSPCIDAGSPDPIYDESCFDNAVVCTPYARGARRNDMGAYGGPGACCWTLPCLGTVMVTRQPENLAACVNSSAMICVSAIGEQPITYQWRFHGTNINNTPTNVIGGTNSCLIISNVQSNNAGYYSVIVANPLSVEFSTNALLTVTPVCVDINLYAGLTVTGGTTGKVYRVQYVTNLNDAAWSTLTMVTQRVSGVFVLDPQPANLQRKFYRVIP